MARWSDTPPKILLEINDIDHQFVVPVEPDRVALDTYCCCMPGTSAARWIILAQLPLLSQASDRYRRRLAQSIQANAIQDLLNWLMERMVQRCDSWLKAAVSLHGTRQQSMMSISVLLNTAFIRNGSGFQCSSAIIGLIWPFKDTQ